MEKFYSVFNTRTREYLSFGDSELTSNLDDAKLLAEAHNWAVREPEFQNYTVLTVIFDPEV